TATPSQYMSYAPLRCWIGNSRQRAAGDVDAHPVERSRGGHEQRLQVVASEAEIGDVFGRFQHAQAGCVWREDVDAAGAAAPDVPPRVELHAVGRAGALALGLRPDPAALQAAVGLNVEDADVLT